MSDQENETVDLSVLEDPSVKITTEDGKISLVFDAAAWLAQHGFTSRDHLFVKAMLTKLFQALHDKYAQTAVRGLFLHTWTIEHGTRGASTAPIVTAQFDLDALFEHFLEHADASQFKLEIAEVMNEYQVGVRILERVVAQSYWYNDAGNEPKFVAMGNYALWVDTRWIHERHELTKLTTKIRNLGNCVDKNAFEAAMADIEDDLFVLYERK